jgi:hypothetical protein
MYEIVKDCKLYLALLSDLYGNKKLLTALITNVAVYKQLSTVRPNRCIEKAYYLLS